MERRTIESRRQFSISISGEKGRITRILTPVTNLFIRMADGFDVVAWSRGEA
jgi:hypothetical protein